MQIGAPYEITPYIHVFRPSGQLHVVTLFKFAPGEFVKLVSSRLANRKHQIKKEYYDIPFQFGAPYETRTRVSGVRGQRILFH